MRSSSHPPEDPFHDLRGLVSIHPLEILVEDPLGMLERHYGDGSIPRGGVPPLAVSLVKVSSNDDDTESFLGRTKVLHFVNGRAVSSLQSADQARMLYEHAVTAIARLRATQNPSYNKEQSSGPAIKAELAKLIAENVQDQTFYLMVAHLDGSTPVVVDIF